MSQIPQCICPIIHNATEQNVSISDVYLCIMECGTGALWDLYDLQNTFRMWHFRMCLRKCKCCILIPISLKFVSEVPSDNKSALFQVTAIVGTTLSMEICSYSTFTGAYSSMYN